MSLPYFAKSLSWWLRFFVLPLHRISKNPSISHLLLPAVLSLSTCLPHGFGCLPAVLSSATLGPLRLQATISIYPSRRRIFAKGYAKIRRAGGELLRKGIYAIRMASRGPHRKSTSAIPQPQRALGSKETAPYLLTYFSLQAVRRHVHRK